MNIIQAIEDPNLFQPYLGKLDSWRTWMTALRTIYGLPVKDKTSRDLIRQCTGRDPAKLPKAGFDVALLLTGRRSGKSRTAAAVGAFEAALAGHEAKLSKGEHGVVVICAPSRSQGRIIKDYTRSIFDTPMLRPEVVSETKDGFELRNGNRIEILAGDWKTIRGFTVLACCLDEACFVGYDADSKVKSDTELVRAILPALATVGGRLIAISTPYARKGWCWKQFENNFGNDNGRTLVWNCPSRVMNTTLPQSVVDAALAEDLASAKAEYLGEFRDDVAAYLPREVIQAVVAKGRQQLLHENGVQYHAFVDLSGGRSDTAALAIAHNDTRRKVIIDLIETHEAPFDPFYVCGLMAQTCKKFRVTSVVGDNYSAEFVARAFESCGLHYNGPGRRGFTPKPKSQLYAELLPRICSREIELLDHPVLIEQLARLERRTRQGGRDIIDHPPGLHDDVANCIAGVADCCATRMVMRTGSMFDPPEARWAGLGDPQSVNYSAWDRHVAEYQREMHRADANKPEIENLRIGSSIFRGQ